MKKRTKKILGDVAIVEWIVLILYVVLLYVVEPTTYNTIHVLGTVFTIVFGVAAGLTYIISEQSYDKKEKKKKEKQEQKKKKKQRQKESKEFVRNNIPIEEWAQVVPKEKNDDFLLDIIDVANIYAYREDETSEVKIYLEFHFETENKRFYERVKKRRFTKYYEIK